MDTGMQPKFSTARKTCSNEQKAGIIYHKNRLKETKEVENVSYMSKYLSRVPTELVNSLTLVTSQWGVT